MVIGPEVVPFWFIFRILQGNPKKELLRGPWVGNIQGGCAVGLTLRVQVH